MEKIIGLAGDWHADTGWALESLNVFKKHNITTIVHLGDFGVWPGHSGATYMRKVNQRLKNNNQTLYVVLGNHEDYTKIESFTPHPDLKDFVYHPYMENIVYANRGARWEWHNRSFVALGGANSIDYKSRTEWVDWWAGERITLADVYNTVNGGHAEIMLCHDTPAGVPIEKYLPKYSAWTADEIAYSHESRVMLRQAVDGVKPSMLFHGHYHLFIDEDVVLNDGDEDYKFRNIGLDMNGNANNLGTLNLETLNFVVIK